MYWIFFCYSLFRCRCRFYLQVRKVVDTNEKEKIQGSSPWHKLEMYNIYRQFVYHMLTDIMPWIGVTVESKFIFIYFYGFLEHQSIFWASSYYIKVCRDFVLYNNFFTKHWVLYTCGLIFTYFTDDFVIVKMHTVQVTRKLLKKKVFQISEFKYEKNNVYIFFCYGLLQSFQPFMAY